MEARDRARSKRVLRATFVGVLVSTTPARAEPLRLRGDAFASTPSPTGLVVLQGEDARRPWISAEGLAWIGAGEERNPGDVLALVIKLRDPGGRGEVRAGRMLVATGSVRPVQLDGATALGRTPWGTSMEVFGGAPVVPRFGERAYDWAVGGRVGQTIAERAVVGVAYVQQRDHGETAHEEIGTDFTFVPWRAFELAARGAYDLLSPGVTDALASLGARLSAFRFELFGTHRSPARLLPATSLFSVLGDVPATRAGGAVRWYAAPRLDLFGSGAAELQDERSGYDAVLRATLRTDEEGEGSVGVEGRRQGIPGISWTGARAIAAVPLAKLWRASTEVELAVPDDPRGRGALWPWALVALRWRALPGWEFATAGEAAVRPNVARELTVLARASYVWSK